MENLLSYRDVEYLFREKKFQILSFTSSKLIFKRGCIFWRLKSLRCHFPLVILALFTVTLTLTHLCKRNTKYSKIIIWFKDIFCLPNKHVQITHTNAQTHTLTYSYILRLVELFFKCSIISKSSQCQGHIILYNIW